MCEYGIVPSHPTGTKVLMYGPHVGGGRLRDDGLAAACSFNPTLSASITSFEPSDWGQLSLQGWLYFA